MEPDKSRLGITPKHRNGTQQERKASGRRVLFYVPSLETRGGIQRGIEALLGTLGRRFEVYMLTETGTVNTFEGINNYYRNHPERILSCRWFPYTFAPASYRSIASRLWLEKTSTQTTSEVAAKLKPFVVVPFLRGVITMRSWLLRHALANIRPALVVVFVANIYSLLAIRSVDVPTVVWIHTPVELRPGLRVLNKEIENIGGQRFSSKWIFCANSMFMLENLKSKLGGIATEVLYPPYNEAFYWFRDDLRSPGSILMVGRIDPSKRIELGIQALNALKTKHRFPNLSLKIVGDVRFPKYLRSLQDQVHRYGLDEEVTFVTKGDPSAIRAAYHESTIFWNFSEGYYGVTNIEAMACGCIPLVMKSMGDIVPSDLLVCDSVDGFSEKTAKLLHDEDALVSIRRVVVQHAARFSTKQFSEDVHHVLRRLEGGLPTSL